MPQKSFDDLITDLDDGELRNRLTEELQQVVRGVRRSNLAGSLILKLSVKPDGRAILIIPQVTTKIPTAKSNSTLFYDTEDGDLSRNDPKQLTLRTVAPKPPTRLRVAGQDAQAPNEDTDDKKGEN